MTSYDRLTGRENSPLASIQGTNVLSDVSNHTSDTSITMTDKKVVCSTDSISTELLSRSDCVTDQSSKNSKKVFLCDKTLVEEIFPMMTLAQNSVMVTLHCGLLLTDTYFK